jgi:hypothetical protein
MRRKDTISDLLLEQYVLGELPPAMAEKVRDELARDPSLKARYEEIISSDKEILERYPPGDLAKSIGQRLERRRDEEHADAVRAGSVGITASLEPAGRWALQLAVGLPAAAVVLLVLSFFVFRERFTIGDIRVKGLAPHLSAFLKTAQGARDLLPGSEVGRGDVIQLSYTAAEAKYGVILWVDGRGVITWLLPTGFTGTLRPAPLLDRRGQVILPTAYELDDAPGFERFFFVYAENPFNAVLVADAARALVSRVGSAERLDLVLPPGIKQYSLLLRKRGPES